MIRDSGGVPEGFVAVRAKNDYGRKFVRSNNQGVIWREAGFGQGGQNAHEVFVELMLRLNKLITN